MLNLVDLKPAVRERMLAEVMADQAAGAGFVSPRLTPLGARDYPELLQEAVRCHDDVWLEGELNRVGRLKTHEERRTKNGVSFVRVPVTAAQTLAEGEFNRFYVRGLCLTVLADNAEAVLEVYRAKPVERPRPESEAIIGKRVKASTLLADLRANKGDMNTALGIPAGPNSGLSVRIPAA